MIYNRVPFVVLWYCGACLLDPGLIYYHVKNCSFLEMKDGKDPLRASHYFNNLLKHMLCATFVFLCLLIVTQGDGLPACCFVLLSTASCNYEPVVIQSLSPPL